MYQPTTHLSFWWRSFLSGTCQHLPWGAGEGACGTAYIMEAAHAKDPSHCSYSEGDPGEDFSQYTSAWGKCVCVCESMLCVSWNQQKNIVIIILFFLGWCWGKKEEEEVPGLQAIWWCQDKHKAHWWHVPHVLFRCINMHLVHFNLFIFVYFCF